MSHTQLPMVQPFMKPSQRRERRTHDTNILLLHANISHCSSS